MDCIGSPTQNTLRPSPCLPAGRQQPHQFQLGARGVLEFVHQDVLQTIVEAQSQIGRRIRRSQRAQRGQATPRENPPHPARETPGPTPPRPAPTPAPLRAPVPIARRYRPAPGSVRISQRVRRALGSRSRSCRRSSHGSFVGARRRETFVLGESLAKLTCLGEQAAAQRRAIARDPGIVAARRSGHRPSASRPGPAAANRHAPRGAVHQPRQARRFVAPPSASRARSARATPAAASPHRSVAARARADASSNALAACSRPASSGNHRSRLGSMAAISFSKLAPALIVEREHAIDGDAESIIGFAMRQCAAGRLFVACGWHRQALETRIPRPRKWAAGPRATR